MDGMKKHYGKTFFNHSKFDAYMRVSNARKFCFANATKEYLTELLRYLENWTKAVKEELAGLDTCMDVKCHKCGRHRPFGDEDWRLLTPDGKLFCKECYIEYKMINLSSDELPELENLYK